MRILNESAFLLGLAVLLAIIEVEAEGKNGWGEKFPTYYRVKTGWLVKIWRLANPKPLTGYHLALLPFTIGIFMFPIVKSGKVTLSATAEAASDYLVWTAIAWDFSWFALNPYYGLSNFRRNKVWWFSHEYWLFGRIPSSYLKAITGSMLLAALAGWAGGDVVQMLREQATQLGYYLAGLVLLLWLLTPLYHTYYKRMRRIDERHLAGIFPSGKDAEPKGRATFTRDIV